MFTGIIDHCGKIIKIDSIPSGYRIWIDSQFRDLVLGESIAVDGICLTVTEINHTQFSCDISPETLKLTTAKNFTANKLINLERALQLSSRLGGHMVSGHIDQVATLKSIRQVGEFTEMIFTNVRKCNLMINKGSIAINGVSLTINDIRENECEVMLVPHTLERTNLSQLTIGGEVNIEYDMIAKIVAEQVKH